jgi:hypothetical protein
VNLTRGIDSAQPYFFDFAAMAAAPWPALRFLCQSQKFRPLRECSQVMYSLRSSTCFAYHVAHHSFHVPGNSAASHSSSASTIRWPLS